MDTHLTQCLPIIYTHLQDNYQTEVEQQIVSTILSSLKCFELYKDLQVHTKVKEVCPWEQLSLESSEKMSKIKRNSSEDSIKIDSRDLFLIELLNWFKKDFFQWFQEPICSKCSTDNKLIQMKFNRYSNSNFEEQKWRASNVEIYKCPFCKNENRFPRFNHPLKLLETRTGRCGEFANCFSAMCIVFNYEVRKVSELSDHVWLEVYSESSQRWVHCDPCENAIDTPLMYEAGWNKMISFCIAVSDREIQDVTWNYTLKQKDIQERRRKVCNEIWLLKLILFVTNTLQNKLDPQIVREMNERRVKELVSYLWTPNKKQRELKTNETQGRQSGSLMWRLARGEINDKEEDNGLVKNNFMFKPNLNKLVNNCYIIRFNCVKDEYQFDGKQMKGWQNCVFLYRNIFKKVENDWKMTYLARLEGSNFDQSGLIEWGIDLEDLKQNNLEWKTIEIYILSKVYENGCVKMYISSEPEKIKLRINENERNIIRRDQFPISSTKLYLTVEFSGGKGDCSYQHAQLFRQNLFTDCSLNGLEILINF